VRWAIREKISCHKIFLGRELSVGNRYLFSFRLFHFHPFDFIWVRLREFFRRDLSCCDVVWLGLGPIVRSFVFGHVSVQGN
jgi:hypothetical protein